MYPARTRSSRLPTRSSIVEAARSYIGVRFSHRGRSRTTGFDCAGLPLRIGWDLGLVEPDFDPWYSRRPDHIELLRHLKSRLTPILWDDRQPGDIVYIADLNWVHIGILTGPDSMIHAYAKRPHAVCEHRIDSTWRARIRATFSYPGL
jgi:cell wall-associated NlpC family hydrolase